MSTHVYPFALRERLGDSGVSALSEVLVESRDEVMMLVADRFEHRLSEECGKLRNELYALRVDLRADFKAEVAHVRADLIKWSFLFWIGQLAAVVSLASLLRLRTRAR